MNALVFPLQSVNNVNATDPIFAAIDEHRATWRSADDEDWENGDEGKRLEQAWSRREEAAFAKLAKTTPTTLAGIAALAAYEKEDDDRRLALMNTIQRAAKRLANPPKAKSDAKLLMLGEKARNALRDYVAAVKAFNRADDEVPALEPEMTKAGKDIAALLRRIGKQKAHTLAGVKIKLEAEVVARTYPDEWDQVVLQGGCETGLVGIIDDLEGIKLRERRADEIPASPRAKRRAA